MAGAGMSGNSGYQDAPAFYGERFYVGVDDQLLVQAISNVATQTLTVNGRLLRDDGVIVPFSFVFQTGSAVALLSKVAQLAQGFLLGLQVASPAAATSGQWMYVKVSLTRGGQNPPLAFQALYAGYVGSSFSFGFPETPAQRPTDGPGTLRSIQVATPAAGAEWTITVPANSQWRVISGSALLTTSATVANRSPGAMITDGTNTLYRNESASSLSASAAKYVAYVPNIFTQSLGGGEFYAVIPPDLVMRAGWVLSSETLLLQAGDAYTAISLLVSEWALVL